jgi:hypothetical protein
VFLYRPIIIDVKEDVDIVWHFLMEILEMVVFNCVFSENLVYSLLHFVALNS